jgi:hypothetical protein
MACSVELKLTVKKTGCGIGLVCGRFWENIGLMIQAGRVVDLAVFPGPETALGNKSIYA